MTFLLALTLTLTPTYAVRFNLLHFPTNLLMVWVVFVWIVFFFWLIAKNKFPEFLNFRKNLNKKLLWLIALFAASGIISLFVRGLDRAMLGQFIVLFVQPISLFFIGGFVLQKNDKAKNLLLVTCYCLLALAGLYAIIQYFTLIGLPAAWWGNSQEPKRALAFFVHPNFYALWSAPLLALLIPDVIQRAKGQGLRAKLAAVFWIIGGLGLLLSLSRAGWLGMAAAIAVYTFVAADKKVKKLILGGAIVIALIIISIPNLRWRVLLPFYGEKSADSRVELWQSGLKGIKESPILGLGLNGYANQYKNLQTDSALDTHNFPHNIFLDLWVETGVLGLISLIGLIGLYIYQAFKNRQNPYALGIGLFLIALIFSGLVDNPYFKNDLAMIFWLVLSLAI